MLKNYLKVAVRNLWKNKGYSAINILGLAVGLATCLLIVLYVWDELGYDRYNTKAERIYRVDGDIKFGGNHFILAVASDPTAAALLHDYPQVEQAVRFRGYGGFRVTKDNESLQEKRVIYTDASLFDVFTLPVLNGDPKTALKEPNSVVITETTARRYFNSTDVVGKNLLVNDTANVKITAVIKDLPVQSHFNFDFFVSLAGVTEARQNDWLSNNFNTYIVLKKGADPKALEAQFDAMVNKYVGPQAKQILNISMEDLKKDGNYVRYTLTPLLDIHLHSNKTAELGANSNIQYVYIFSIIALFILLIACVNFMNLATARSSNRAKEVGVRKVLGSLRSNLIGQFLSESMLISFVSLVLALLLVVVLLPWFNNLAGKQINIGLFGNPWLISSLIALVAVVGLLAGSYPAFFLSAFSPIQVLKGKLGAGFKNSWLRSSLVVFQFTISIILIISTTVIYRQLNYIRNKNLGFQREQVLVLQNTDALRKNAGAFKEELLKMPGVENITMTGYLPTNDWRSDNPLFPDPANTKNALSTQVWRVDENYIPTLGMKMLQGRNFSKAFPTDSTGLVINEAAAKLLAFKDPVNKALWYLKDFPDKTMSRLHIIGVVKDFNFNSLRQQVTPLVLMLSPQSGCMALRINTKNIPGLLAQIEHTWQAMASGRRFSYSFMDDDFNKQYNAEQRTGKIFISFAMLAILIACLGLFGLITYAAEQRIKEIGIRKVLGASVGNIVGMLSADFLKLVMLSGLLAFPFAWWAMNKWLKDFAYRIDIGWWVFVAAGAIAVLIALTTVSFRAIQAALANPVKSLRSE